MSVLTLDKKAIFDMICIVNIDLNWMRSVTLITTNPILTVLIKTRKLICSSENNEVAVRLFPLYTASNASQPIRLTIFLYLLLESKSWGVTRMGKLMVLSTVSICNHSSSVMSSLSINQWWQCCMVDPPFGWHVMLWSSNKLLQSMYENLWIDFCPQCRLEPFLPTLETA